MMPDDRRNIIITGFMGTGKTTTSAIVAQTLGRDWLDMDAVIVQEAGMSISQIFAQQGESAFRQMERDLIERLAVPQSLVIATGGGALVPEMNRRQMLKNAFVVCLHAAPDVIEARLRQDGVGRPLAAGWRELLQQRQSAYDSIPARVDTSNKTPQQVAEEIIALWQNASR